MIKIKLSLIGCLRLKYSCNIIELSYNVPVKIKQILCDANISCADVFFVKKDNLLVNEDYIVKDSCMLKLLPIVGGG